MDSLRRDKRFHPKKIETTPEYMHKLFIMPDSPDHFVEFGEHLLDMIHDFFQEKGGIHSAVSLKDLAKIFDWQTATTNGGVYGAATDTLRHG